MPIKRRLLGAAVSIALGLITMTACLVESQDDYRFAGYSMLEQAKGATNAQKSGASRFGGAALPAQLLLVQLSGAGTSDAPFEALARANGVLTGAAVAIVAWLGFVFGGWLGCVAAFGAMLLLPSTLYQGRNAGSEALVTLAWALLLWAGTLQFKRGLSVVLATLAFALAVSSWHEAVWYIIPWFIAAHFVVDAPKSSEHRGTFAVGRLQLGYLIAAVAGPLLVFALWPHLGDDLGKRLVSVIYEPLKAKHVPILIAGEVHDQAITRAPGVGQAWLVILLRVPLVAGVLAVAGLGRAVWGMKRRDPILRHLAFVVVGLATGLLIAGLNGSPYYAGTDGVAHLGPFIALLAAVGFVGVIRTAQSTGRAWIPWVVGGLLIVPAVVDRAVHYGSEASYHSVLAGSAAGAASQGFELRPTAAVPVDLVEWMNTHLPQNAEVAIYPAEDRYRALLDRLGRDGVLRSDIKTAAPYHGTHLLIVEHPAYPLFADRVTTAGVAIATIEVDGALLMTLYRY